MCVCMAFTINVLCQSNVGDAGGIIAKQMNMRIQYGRINCFAIFAKHRIEIEFMEI